MTKFNLKLLILLFLAYNLFADDIATITALQGEADIKRENAITVASLGSKLQQNDNIVTKENGKVQLIFKDETIVTIGKNSEFSIAQYLFEDNAEPIAKFNMIRGAMRTITGRIGDIAPQKFSVATTTATIGIRGTNFSVFVEEDGSSSAFCTYGTISVSIADAIYVVQQGFYLSLSPIGEVSIKAFTPKLLKKKKDQYFKVQNKQRNRYKGSKEHAQEENDAHLDLTRTDNSQFIIKDISDIVEDTTQQSAPIIEPVTAPTINVTLSTAG